MWYLKKLLVAEAVQQSSLHSAPLSSSSSLVGTARLTVSPFRRRRNEEKKAAEVEKSFSSSSSAPAIDPSDASAVAASYTSAGAMNDIERRLGPGCVDGGVVCEYDVAFLEMLSVPLVAPLQSLAVSVGTKSGRKRIFAAADVDVHSSIYDLFDPSLQIWRSPQSRHAE